MTTITKIEQLAVKHDYYCSSENGYSNYCDNFKEFYNNFKDSDIDMNLIFRYDIEFDDENDCYKMYLYTMLQRKGILLEHVIRKVVDEDVPYILDLLNKHKQKLISLWSPL